MILNRNYYEMAGRSTEVEDFFLPTDVMLLYLPLAHNFGRLMHLLGAHVGYTIAFLLRPARDRRRDAAGAADGPADACRASSRRCTPDVTANFAAARASSGA